MAAFFEVPVLIFRAGFLKLRRPKKKMPKCNMTLPQAPRGYLLFAGPSRGEFRTRGDSFYRANVTVGHALIVDAEACPNTTVVIKSARFS